MVKLSIIIPVYNSHEIVRRQIVHFKKMHLPDTVEIIFMDDGSNPSLLDQFKDVDLDNFYIYPTNDFRPWTQPCAKNMGVELCDGEYIFITDIDHILPKKVLREAMAFTGDKMEFTREFAVLTKTGTITQDLKTMIRYGYTKNRYKRRSFRHCRHTNTFVMRKKIFQNIGGYPERLCDKGIQNHLDDGWLFKRYAIHQRAGKCQPSVFGSTVYTFPGTTTNTKLFHNLDRTLG